MLLKRLAAGLLAAAMVIAAAAFAAPYLIPSNLIKARLAALVQQRTGRQLLISGPVQIALLPQPRLMADGVALASPWGDFSADFLSAARLEASFKTGELLRGIMAIDRISLSRATINFEVDQQGRRNWQMRRPTTTGPGNDGGGPVGGITSGMLTLNDTTVIYRDRRTGFRQVATAVNLEGAAETGRGTCLGELWCPPGGLPRAGRASMP